jgi:hypothetical protein
VLESGESEMIQKMFHRMRGEVRALLMNIISLVYFMRGAIQYEDMLQRTPAERQLFEEFIERRLEMQKDSMFPVY